jgi:hypothetical protein
VRPVNEFLVYPGGLRDGGVCEAVAQGLRAGGLLEGVAAVAGVADAVEVHGSFLAFSVGDGSLDLFLGRVSMLLTGLEMVEQLPWVRRRWS